MDGTADSLSSIWVASAAAGIGPVVFLLLLLGCSAFFSGSETAFFNLPRRQVRQFATSPLRLERLTARVLSNSNRFLTALLFGNMTVNVLYFAASSMLSVRVGRAAGPQYGTAAAVLCFLVILLCGEMLPKSIAYSNSRRFCLMAAPGCYVLMRGLSPLLKVLDFLLIQPVVRLFVNPGHTAPISVNQLRTLLDLSRRNGLISHDENQLLDEILKFSVLKARHVMQPRVEMPACPVTATPAEVRRLMRDRGIVRVPVYVRSIDRIVGIVHFRDLLLNPAGPVDAMVRPVRFVPEQSTVESLVDFFRQAHTDMAIVVDEYGGIAGCVERDDIVEQLLGQAEDWTGQEPIEQIGPLRYRLLAQLSIHDWDQAFGINIGRRRLVTLGGFVTALLGKIPKPGDAAIFRNMTFTVETVDNHRIRTVILSLEPGGDNGTAAATEAP